VIRFSAALVAVAIGVLIGGIATSKLLLVYIAIVVSAVALVALAIGVAVKREELFGEGQGLVPAGAGAAPGRSAPAGESHDQHRVVADRPVTAPDWPGVAADRPGATADWPSPAVSVPPSVPGTGSTAGHGAAFGGTAVGAGGSAFGETAQVAAPSAAPPQSAANPLAPPTAAEPVASWEAQSARDQWSSSPWPSRTAADPAPDRMPSGTDVNEPGVPAAATAPTPTSAVFPRPPARSGRSSAGAEPVTNWFAPKVRSAGADPPAMEAPADAASADQSASAPAGRGAGQAREAAADETPAGDVVADGDAPDGDIPSAEATASVAVVGQEPGSATETGPQTETEREPGPAESETGDADGEGSAGQDGPAAAAVMVAVLPGVPRYHQPDCVLIRFMPEDDIQRLPVAQAKADGCTPCAACQPAE